MDYNELKAQIVRKGFNVKSLAHKIGISHSAFHRKLKGTSEFDREEISNLSNLLELTPGDVYKIFFSKSVS